MSEPADTLVYLFAAGSSQRLGAAGDGTPKSLLEVGGRRLIDFHLENAVALGVRRLAIVVGYRAQEYRAAVGDHYRGVPIEYVPNPFFAEFGQVHSLRVGRALFDRPAVLVNADVLCPPDFMGRLLAAPEPNVMLLDPDYPVLTGDEVIICGEGGRVTGLALGSPADGQGEFIGVNKFGPGFLNDWCDYIDRLFESRWKGENYEWALNGYLEHAAQTGHPVEEIRYLQVGTRDWVNVNYPDDLVTARSIAGKLAAGELATTAQPARP